MAEVLSQTEVEALLEALDTSTPAMPTARAQRLSDPSSQISVYDFKRPERVSKEQIRAFQALHESFSREFGAGLSGMLRSIVEVKQISVDQLTYSEFVYSLENPTCFNLLELGGLDGHIILDLSPSILFPIIDRLMGGGREASPTFPNRPLSEIELKLVSRVTEIAIKALEHAWSHLCSLQLSLMQVESNPQLVQIVPPNEVIVLLSFEITMGEMRGIMNICIPFNTIEPLAGKLSSEMWSAYRKKSADPRQRVNLETGLAQAPVELSVNVAHTKLSTSDAAGLCVGDVIVTETPVGEGVEVQIAGRPMYRASAGLLNGHKAIRIQRKLVPKREIIAEKLQTMGIDTSQVDPEPSNSAKIS